jgi:hypothetical protein
MMVEMFGTNGMTGAASVDCLLHGPNTSASNRTACQFWDPNHGIAKHRRFGTVGQPAGRRVVRIDVVDELEWRNLWNSSDRPPIWLDGAVAVLRKQSATFFAKFHAAGGHIDELVFDTELFGPHPRNQSDPLPPLKQFTPGFWSEPTQQPASAALSALGNASYIRQQLRAGWTEIQLDPRFPQALSELQEQGFIVDASQPHYLADAMVRFADTPEGILAQLPRSKGGNPNRAIYDQWLMGKRSLYMYTAFIEPALKFFPELHSSNYHYSRGRNDGKYCVFSDLNMLSCLAGPGAVGYSLQAPSINLGAPVTQAFGNTNWSYGVQLVRTSLNIGIAEAVQGFTGSDEEYLDGFNPMRRAAYLVRANALAAPPGSATPAPVKPWIHTRHYVQGPRAFAYNPLARLDYWHEALFHFALSGSPAFYFFNPNDCQIMDPLGNPLPEDIVALSDNLAELTRLAGCAKREWKIDSRPPRLRDNMMLTGMSLSTGAAPPHTLWRLTAPPLPNNKSVESITVAGAGGALVVTGLALQGPEQTQRPSNGTRSCSLNFPAAHIVPGKVSVQLGVWIRQPPEAAAPFTQCGSWREHVYDDATVRRNSVKTDDTRVANTAFGHQRYPGAVRSSDTAADWLRNRVSNRHPSRLHRDAQLHTGLSAVGSGARVYKLATDFGADPTGIVDATPAFARALATAWANAKGTNSSNQQHEPDLAG